MWKYLCRGIRETFERRINFRQKDKAAGQECPIGAIQNKLIPGIVSTNKFDNGTSDLGGRCKNGSCNDKKRQNGEQHGERWRHNGGIQEPMLLGALGWSGVMILGWYLCQPVCRRRCAQPPELERLKSRAGLSHCHKEYGSLFGALLRIVLAQPLSILPKRAAKHVPSPSVPQTVQPQSSSTISVDLSDGPENYVSEPKFGPVTAEEALDEAADNLTKAQNTVMSGIENRLGVACMQLGKYKEAHVYFHRAVQLGNAPAAFNMGLCYETGAGTSQDFKLAAEYYGLASKWGHSTAMYNLGVFYVHGWGGVPVDCNRARQLFIAAAELGQTNAKEALSMVLPASSKGFKVHNEETELSEPEEVAYEPNPVNVLYQILGIMKSRLPMAESRKSLQSVLPADPDATKLFYQAVGTDELEVLGSKVGETIREDINLRNELIINNNVATECKDVSHFSIVC